MTTMLMLDFETLSLKENAVLLSLGACVFDPATGEIGETFYTAIDPRTQHGRDISASTVLWWLEQDQAARDKLTGAVKAADLLVDADPDSQEWADLAEQAAIPINHAAMAFIAFVEQFDDVECWTNGGVDHTWLNSMFEYSGFKNPIPFWKQRDYRTLKALYPDIKAETWGQAHNALDDAIKQAKHAAKIISTIGVDHVPPAPYAEWINRARGAEVE